MTVRMDTTTVDSGSQVYLSLQRTVPSFDAELQFHHGTVLTYSYAQGTGDAVCAQNTNMKESF